MKRLILKFKHWLIKKLGGYTEQHMDNRRVDAHSHQLRPIVLRAEIACQLAHKLVDYYWIKQLDGKLPSTVLGSDSSYMIDLR